MTTAAARTTGQDGAHWYSKGAQAVYEVPYADPRKGMRPTTLTDAKKMGLLPSVTTILKALHKQALVDWLIEQACLAVLTTPRNEGEDIDAFVHRVLHVEKVQNQESDIAKDKGTAIHAALEVACAGGEVDNEVWPWASGAYVEIMKRGRTVRTESIVVGEGYAGKVDLIQESDEIWVWDWKTTKKLPAKGAWTEHVLQAAAYAAALARNTGDKRIRTGNVYISTVDQGQFAVCEHADWQDTYENGFKPLVRVWQHLNAYKPI